MSNPDNSCALAGRITADPIFLKTKSGEEFQARFTLAVRRAYKNKEGEYQADFIPMRFNGVNRMGLAHRLEKGASIKVIGEIRSDSFTNKDGNRVFSTFFEVERFNWNGSNHKKKEDQSDRKNTSSPTPQPSASQPSANESKKPKEWDDGYTPDSDFELPFN